MRVGIGCDDWAQNPGCDFEIEQDRLGEGMGEETRGGGVGIVRTRGKERG